MIQEIRIKGTQPIAYTDFNKIYISNTLTGDELELARKHEKAHIWLQHQARTDRLKTKHKKINHHLLNIALDLEIAKHIYTDNDTHTINKPRSFLNGGITQTDCAQYPICVYAEDFYEELLKENKILSKVFDKLIFGKNGKSKGKKIKTSNAKIVAQAKKKSKTHDDKNKAREINHKIATISPPKPSLASEIDHYLGRYKITRIRSYKRPARRESDEFITKGMASRLKAPRLTVYVDRSGSFDSAKTEISINELHTVLLKYRGRIGMDTFYFNDVLFKVDTGNGTGGTNHQVVVNQIVKDRSALSIIITDDDYNPDLTVPEKLPNVLIKKIGCKTTQLSKQLNCKEV